MTEISGQAAWLAMGAPEVSELDEIALVRRGRACSQVVVVAVIALGVVANVRRL